MASTGEVACFGNDLKEAFLKALISVGYTVPKKNILISAGKVEDKAELLEGARELAGMGFNLYATPGTADFFNENGVKTISVAKASESASPNMLDLLEGRKIEMVINIPNKYTDQEMTDGFMIRRKSIDFNIPLITNLQLAKLIMDVIASGTINELEIASWDEYK
jgi:carbamoyl-phosphate synthase large subunit